ncbi:DUF2726 domain-containing protein [Pokkaliibacter sp. CJK22405]|uniref:DUF2726 domain-containing protein n=1 Tax=Pokkaliibacter sp. CJK22405 TaxID=3384615 RepID=UPI00398500DC
MQLLILAVVIVGLLFWWRGQGKGKRLVEPLPDESTENTSEESFLGYQKIERIVTPAERSFLGVLHAVVGEEVLVLSKVRVADVILPQKTPDRRRWKIAFNSIAAKHFDFVLCRADDLSVLCAIELNDKSHENTQRQERDAFLRAACASADLDLIEVPARQGYQLQEVKDLLGAYLNPEPLDDHHDVLCEACGSLMVLRTARKGKNAGNQFLGCSNYPECKHMQPLDSATTEDV